MEVSPPTVQVPCLSRVDPSSSVAQPVTTAQPHKLSSEFYLPDFISQVLSPDQFEAEDLEKAEGHSLACGL